MIAESDDGLDIDCVTDAIVLELERDDFLALSTENFDILEGLLGS